MPDYKFKNGNPADEAKLIALAESNNITLEKLIELNGITVSEEQLPKKQKDGVQGADAPSENQAPDMASLLESGFADSSKEEPKEEPKDINIMPAEIAKEVSYVFGDGQESTEEDILNSLRSLDIKVSGRASQNLYDFKDGKISGIKEDVTDEELVISYLDLFPEKPIKKYKGNELGTVNLVRSKVGIKADRLIKKQLELFKDTPEDYARIESKAEEIFVPEDQFPTKLQAEDNLYPYSLATKRGIVYPDDYQEYVKKANGDLEKAKALYIKDKKVQNKVDKLEIFLDKYPRRTSGFKRELDNAAFLSGVAKKRELDYLANLGKALGDGLKTQTDLQTEIASEKYYTQEEVDLANTQLEELQYSRIALANQYANVADNALDKVNDFKNNALLKDVVSRVYSTEANLFFKAGGSAFTVVGGVLSVPEYIATSVFSIATGDDPLAVRNGMRILNPGFGAYSAFTDGLLDMGESLLSKGQKTTTGGEFNFGAWATDLVATQIPNMAVLIGSGGTAGLGILAASAAGNKYQGMMDEMELYGAEYDGWQVLTVPAVVATAEYFTERLTFGQLKGIKGIFKRNPKAFKEATEYIANNIKGGAYFKTTAMESVGEGITVLAENAADIVVLGKKDVNIWDGVPNALASGAFMSGVIFKAPAIGAKLLNPFASKDTAQTLANNYSQIEKLSRELVKENLDPDLRSNIESAIAEIQKNSAKVLSDSYVNIDNLTEAEKNTLISVDKQSAKLRADYAKTKNDQTIDQDTKDALLKKIEAEFGEINAGKERILSTGKTRGEVIAVEKGANKLFNGQVAVINKSQAEIIAWIEKNKDNFSSLKNSLKNKTAKQIASSSYGIEVTDEKTGKTVLLLNQDLNTRDFKTTTARHEFLHKLLQKTIQNNPNIQVNLGLNLLQELKKQTDGGKLLSETFKKRIGTYISDRALQRDEYGRAINSTKSADALLNIKTVDDLINYMNENLMDPKGEIDYRQFEEIITLTSEALKTKDIVLTETMLSNFKDSIIRFFKDVFNVEIKFDTGKDVLNFIKDYNKVIDEGGDFGSRFDKLANKGASGKLVKKDLNIPTKATGSKEISQSKITPKQQAANDKVDALVGPKDAKGNYISTKAEYDKTGIGEVYSKIIAGNMLDGNIMAGIDEAGLSQKGVNKEDFIEEVKQGLTGTIMRFNPEENNSLIGWINSQLAFRKGDVLKRYRLDPNIGSKSLDVEAGATGSVKEAVASETAEDSLNAESKMAEQEAALDKNPTLLETLPVKQKIDGDKTYQEVITEVVGEKILRNVQLYDSKSPKNRTISLFIAELKMDISDAFYKQTKKFINDYKGGYEGFLVDFKRALLNNYTTTYLARHPLFRKGILKRVKGQWMPPRKITKGGVFKYEWVDKNGKKLKIDRDDAAGRGLTSGPQFIKRNPAINSLIGDAEFVDYHFEDGPKRTKKKQNPEDAVARQVASEVSLEIFQNDLLEDGSLTKLFEDRVELLGGIVANNAAITIANDIDRGLIKFSKVVTPQHETDFIKNANKFAENFRSRSVDLNNVRTALRTTFSDKNYWTEEVINELAIKITPSLRSLTKLKRPKTPVGRKKTISEAIELMQTSVDDGVALAAKFESNESVSSVFRNKPMVFQLQSYNTNMMTSFITDFVKKGGNALDALRVLNTFWQPTVQDGRVPGSGGKSLYYNSAQFQKDLEQALLNYNADNMTDVKFNIKSINNYQSKKSNKVHANFFDGKFDKQKDIDKSDIAWDMSVFAAEWFSKQMKNDVESGIINSIMPAAMFTLFLAPSDSTIRSAAPVFGALKDSRIKDIKRYNYDHTLPARYVVSRLIDKFYYGKKVDLNVLKEDYIVTIITKKLEVKLKDLGLQSMMPGTYIEGKTDSFTRYVAVDAGIPIKFSKVEGSINDRVNSMIEGVAGIPAAEIISRGRGRSLGENKKGALFVPYSHEDFLGLMYPLVGKGKQGDQDLEFIKKAILTPFAQAEHAITRERLNTAAEFRALKKQINKELGSTSLSKELGKEAVDGFTNEQALRVWIWDNQGMDVPGLNEKDIKKLKSAVMKNPQLALYGLKLRGLLNGEYPTPSNSWQGGNISYDIQQNLENTRREFHLETWQANVDEMFSADNKAKLEAAFGPKYIEALNNMLQRMKTGRNRAKGNSRIENALLDYLNGSVAAIMALNTKSALLQQLSNINFINWTDNNPLKAAQAFANQPRYWRDVVDLLNSDYLRNRRSGLKINVTESELAEAAKSDNKVTAFIGLLGQKGFVLTQYGDSFAIASGGATFFRNRFKTYSKETDADGNKLYTEEQAKEKAMADFMEISEDNQQSSRTDKISMQQSSNLGRLFLAFANTPAQYARLTKKAALDLSNGRGDPKTNISKILYYGFVQNLYFSFLQKGLFSMLFDDDDDDEAKNQAEADKNKKKAFEMANSSLDSVLRGGGGIGGATLSMAKNLIIKGLAKYKKYANNERANFADLSREPLQISPPISAKFTKLRQAGAAFDYNKWEIENRGLALDNPALLAGARGTTAITNIPLDRLIIKAKNMKNAMDSDLEVWQRVASSLGWQDWELGIVDPNAETEDAQKKVERKAKAKATRDKTAAEKVATEKLRLSKMSAQEIAQEEYDNLMKRRASGKKGSITRKKNKKTKDSLDLEILKRSILNK